MFLLIPCPIDFHYSTYKHDWFSLWSHLRALVVFTEQRVRQRTERREENTVGDAERQHHVQVGGESGQPCAQTKGQIGEKIQRTQWEPLLQLLKNGCKRKRWKKVMWVLNNLCVCSNCMVTLLLTWVKSSTKCIDAHPPAAHGDAWIIALVLLWIVVGLWVATKHNLPHKVCVEEQHPLER